MEVPLGLQQLTDSQEFDPNFEIEEAQTEVDGEYILAKVKGQFFVPDGTSRNKRYYPKALWEKVLNSAEVTDKLKSRRMFGTISHNQEINDDALREGKISHIITNLYIDDKNRGMGEALILNTPSGKILNTFLRAGSKLHVSSRAYGKFNGQNHGIPVVDEDAYQFSGFDYVIDPGFTQASPELVESIKELEKIEGETMERELIEKVVTENVNLKNDLTKAIAESKKLNEESEDLEQENKDLKAKIADLEARIKELEGKNGQVTELSDKYKALGTPKEISDALDTCEAVIKKYKAHGTPEEIKEALEKSMALLNEYKALGTPKQLNDAIDQSEEVILKYKAIGSPEEVSEAINKSYSLVKAYKEFGSVEELKEAFKKMNKVVASMKNENHQKRVSELSKELQVPEENIAKLYGKIEESEIRNIFKKTKESDKLKNTFKAPEKKLNEVKEKKEHNGKNPMFKTSVNRLMESFN